MIMAMANKLGAIGWMDLTVDNADQIREFYADVIGWEPQAISMGDYSDYCMTPKGDEASAPVAGICHRRGSNANLPPAWIVYLTVADIDASLARVTALGGLVLAQTRNAGSGQYAVIQDPAGAVCALYQAS